MSVPVEPPMITVYLDNLDTLWAVYVGEEGNKKETYKLSVQRHVWVRNGMPTQLNITVSQSV